MTGPTCGVVQLPSERLGYKLIVPSAVFQALREANAVGFGFANPASVRELLERRQAQEAERARKRKARETRWLAIREGRQPAHTVSETERMHSDSSGPMIRSVKSLRGARKEASGLDRLLAAVDSKVAA